MRVLGSENAGCHLPGKGTVRPSTVIQAAEQQLGSMHRPSGTAPPVMVSVPRARLLPPQSPSTNVLSIVLSSSTAPLDTEGPGQQEP